MSDTSAPRTQHELVHVAIVRKVRQGREREFESEIARFFGTAAEQAEASNAYLIRPILGSHSREYGILRSFRSREEMRLFYDSEFYRQWGETVGPLVEGPPQRRELHGMEAFFRGPMPPRWKMAFVTWIGVSPLVYLYSRLVPAIFGELPALVALLSVNALVVTTLTWLAMPILTKLFRPWLQKGNA